MTHVIEQQTESLARLRLLVAMLGEAAHAKWWRTEFLTAAGLRFLDRLYPRTSCAAALRATSVAARDLHDSSVGRGGVYHLFRLPGASEAPLDALARGGFIDQVLPELNPSLDASDPLVPQS